MENDQVSSRLKRSEKDYEIGKKMELSPVITGNSDCIFGNMYLFYGYILSILS